MATRDLLIDDDEPITITAELRLLIADERVVNNSSGRIVEKSQATIEVDRAFDIDDSSCRLLCVANDTTRYINTYDVLQ
jgi:hypothetical protein